MALAELHTVWALRAVHAMPGALVSPCTGAGWMQGRSLSGLQDRLRLLAPEQRSQGRGLWVL